VDVVPIKFHQFLFWRVTCYDLFCVYHFFSILAVSMATAAILEKSTPKGTISHGICYSYKVLVERDKPNKSELVGQTLQQLPWKQKKGDLKNFGFLSSNFMKLCRNIHRSVWQLLRG
jgi:chromosome condensin MukBEF ATPase and DNA-binding subunit MukB